MATINVTDEGFQKDVLDSDKPVLVDFWAEWCGPCKMIAPALEELSDELGDKVTVVDFKTARRPPTSLDGVPDSTMRQMAAYVAALQAIYPGRKVEAAVLYTQTPQLIVLPPAELVTYKAAFSKGQESFALPPVE